jgi:dethiobiotin synthetase
MTQLFITATGTEIGKTYVTAALAHLARTRGLAVRVAKPIVSGVDPAALDGSDPAVLAEAAGIPLDAAALDRITPWRFRAPLSPDMAAAREGRAIDFAELVGFSRSVLAGPETVTLIEGVGGVMVPLDRAHTVRDWAAALGIPAVLVAGAYLGTLSHSLTALEALARVGVAVRAIVISAEAEAAVPLDETLASLARFAPGVPILTIPRRPGALSWREAAELAPLIAESVCQVGAVTPTASTQAPS